MADDLKKAQDHLDAATPEDDLAAINILSTAVEKFREAKNADGLADALLLNACAHIAKGLRKEANKLAQDELVSFQTAGHKPGQARMLLAIGEANCKNRGRENKEKALEACCTAQEMFATLGDARNEAKAHLVIANIQVAKGNAADAARAANRAKTLSQSAADKRGEGIAEHCLAVTFAGGGDSEQCLRAAKAAIACFHEAGLKQMEAFQHIVLAKWVNDVEGKPAKALQLALKALEACRTLGSQEHKALGMVVECYLLLARKDATKAGSSLMSAKAVRAAQQGVDTFQAAGNRSGEAHALQSMTMAQISQGMEEDAASTAQAAADAFRDVSDIAGEIQMLQFASNLNHKIGKADQAAATAEEMLKKADSPQDKVSALEAAFSAYMLKKQFSKAKDTAKKMCDILRQAKMKHKEGLAKLRMCEAYYKSGESSSGVSVGREAQAMLNAAQDVVGEARAYRSVAKCHFAAQEYEFAQRAALRARELVRITDDAQAQGNAALLLGNIRLQMLKTLDERTSDQAFTQHFFEMSDAAKEAEWIGTKYANGKLAACGLKLLAEAYTLVNEIPDALKFTKQAAQIFREVDDNWNLAHLLLVEADAWFAGGEQSSANRSCKQALKLFQEQGDEPGIALAEDVMERINPPTPPPELSWEPEKNPGLQTAMEKHVSKELEKVQEPAGTAYTKKQLSKVNLNKIDENLLTATLYNIVQEVVGYDMDFLEDDLPLMQAGIASRQAVTLRAALEDELKGISFPATVVFDFPSISNIREYILDRA